MRWNPFRREKAPKLTGQSAWQLRPNDGQGVYTRYFNNFIPRKVEADFYEFLREAIPVIDSAIMRLVSLDGHIIVTGSNEKLVDEIQEWMDTIVVNDVQQGLQAFHQNLSNETFEQGFGLGEFITNTKRNDIVSLKVADSKYIKFERAANGIDIYQKATGDLDWRKLRPDNLMYFSINNENQNPYGTPLMRSCEFVAKLLATIQNSLGNVWERFGDPSFKLVYKTSKRDGNDHKARAALMKEDLNTAIRDKREGKSADFIYAIDQNSEIELSVIGADGQVLELEVPARHALEQIIAKSGLPPWMLGMHWSTTERLSDAEAEMLLADVRIRQAAKMPVFTRLVQNLLLLRGRTWKKGDWQLEWETANLHDLVKQAQARFLNTQADMMASEGITGSTQAGKTAGVKSCGCGKAHKGRAGTKELNRPTPWPELDEVEDNYEAEMKYDWEEYRKDVFSLLGLGEEFQTAIRKPTPREEQQSKAGRKQEIPDGIPDATTFTFSDEQRSAVMDGLKEFIGKYDWKNSDSAVRWYYGQAYSLGLIQAAHIIGRERPILDIIVNSETFDRIVKDGFKLVKDQATKGVMSKIIPEMEAQVLAGSNPRHVAARLKKLFGDKNSDWERLARTEMTVAAEQAKLDEWKEWEEENVRFVIAPDSCPLCAALAGEYEIAKAPVPGRDTHPRCRCTLAPV